MKMLKDLQYSRRSFLSAGCSVGCSLLAAPLLGRAEYHLPSQESLADRAASLVNRSNVLDMLGLITLDYPKLVSWQTGQIPFATADFERLVRSGVSAIHPAVGFVEGDIYKSSLNDLERWNRFISAHPEKFLRIDRVKDLDVAKATGRVGIILGLQNSSHFRSEDDVDHFHALGQRISQLTYFNNPLGGGSTEPGRGLSPYGLRVVERMNRLGMAIDVSHCSDQTTLDTMEASSKPVLITHSGCRSLVPTSGRCKPDTIIRKLAETGGVFGVTLVRLFVRTSGPATIEDAVDHVDHVVNVAGIDHAGIGTDVDMDGRDSGRPRRNDLDNLSYDRKIFALAEGLLRRNYSERDIQKILGGNFQRVLGQIWPS